MCRMFAVLSVKPSNWRKYLLDDPCSIYVQSNIDSDRLQRDGWGIGFYNGDAPKVVKSDRPVYEEPEKFASAAEDATSKAVIAHIRRASNPKKLPREKLISIENSQPFCYGKYIFAHNGMIALPDEVAASLGEWKMRLRGVNDSEVYFWYLLKEMENGASLPDALKSFGALLWDLWREIGGKADQDRPYVGLNALFSDGDRLYAYCRYEKMDESKVSLCMRDQPVFQMSYLFDSKRLIVSSEKTNREEDWRTIRSGQLLTGEISGDVIELSVRHI